MKKYDWYVVSKYCDNGNVSAKIYSVYELPLCYVNEEYIELDDRSIYIDGFNRLDDAVNWQEQALNC